MEQNDIRGDLIISGSGSASGGAYTDVKINGEGRVFGDLNCDLMKTNGASEVKGNVVARTVQVNGTTKIKGSVETGRVKVNGEARIGGDFKFQDIRCWGTANVKGHVSGELVDLQGELKVDKDCEVETLMAKGAFQIGGLLNAGEIELTLYGNSSAKEIGGEKITVRQRTLTSFLNPFIGLFPNHLTVDTIEGDEIHLENTKAKVVRGNRVTIGAGCEINLVEYKEEFTPLKGGQVHDSKQI